MIWKLISPRIIHADIETLVSEMKSQLGNFRDGIREDLKRELADIKEEIQLNLGEAATNLKATTDCVKQKAI